MGEFEQYTHEQLAGLLAGADPEQLTARADVLVAMARALNGADKQVFVQMSQVEWQGESAEAFRSWGRHLVQESAVLADYARTVGNALQDAGQALSEARAAMPPTPERRAPVSEAAIASVSEELERQEAIHVLERLSSSYRAAADDMATAQEPRFRPLSGLAKPRGGEEPGGPSHASAAAESAWMGQVPSNNVSRGITFESGLESHPVRRVSSPLEGEHATEGLALPHTVADKHVGTSLHSAAPISRPQLPTGEPLPTAAGPNTTGSGGSELPVQVPQPRRVGLFPQRRGLPEAHMTGPQSPGVGQPSVDGGRGDQGVSRSPVGRPVGETGPLVAGGTNGQGPVAGRPPLQGGMRPLGMATSRGTQAPSGIVGGMARQPPSGNRGLPPSAAIGAQSPMAYRDPTTGRVSGPGGVPVMNRAGEASDRPSTAFGNSAKSSQSDDRFSRRSRRRRDRSVNDEPGKTRDRNG